MAMDDAVRGAVQRVRLSKVFRRETDASFLEKVAPLMRTSYGAVFLSGTELDCARHSLAFWNPLFILRSKGLQVSLTTAHGTVTEGLHPLEALDRLLEATRPSVPLLVEPFSGGLVGYLSYELKNVLEVLPQTATDDLNLPESLFFLPKDIMVFDRLTGETVHMTLETKGLTPVAPSPTQEVLERSSTSAQSGNLRSDFSREAYMDAVATIRRYIRNGDVYQVNLSQRFSASFGGNPWFLWTRLFYQNPAPFYAYLHLPGHHILSTSMERFVCRRGDTIETRPIKGTRPRGATAYEDRAMREDLLTNPKDDAELSMIVDLLRNDLGRVCQPRSIVVAEHKRLEGYANVWHLVSVITGKLNPGVSPGQIFRATFPGGSITGCPKIRAMEIIDELEHHVRHVYTGSIGYVGWHDTMDMNIAIRTAILKDDRLYFSVGGGVVYDSDESAEYEETLHKGRTLFQVIERLQEEEACQ
ncbi:aminodeoxychorismate synthase component I [Desulfosoma caldarium]|uniref:aminodeoxychorismate synthase n=1 Tax=Desulfosoma caldarium TaxID=610254 RepID=A0A3N1VHX5_9BACT|nr:aminodeoxychorismate synthase component I [Desulfosoma caldarium]ROR01500.1 aminodeoxychorismate synthase subunit I [Desulfosoma caldarium]